MNDDLANKQTKIYTTISISILCLVRFPLYILAETSMIGKKPYQEGIKSILQRNQLKQSKQI